MSEHTSPMPLRERDGEALNLRVTRSVPAWSIVTGLVVVTLAWGSLNYNQLRQGDQITAAVTAIKEQGDSVKEVGRNVGQLSIDLGKVNTKNVEYEFRISDLDRRLRTIEQRPFPADRPR